jgi:signal transduction histidine kinase
LGLAEAVRQYAREYQQTHGIAADVHIEGLTIDRLPNAVETTLYRIIQEALTNAARHAAARTVSVVLQCAAGWVKAVIEDDGCGFDVEDGGAACGPVGLGIQSMHERAALLNGAVAIESSPGKGTAVYVQIPLKEGA